MTHTEFLTLVIAFLAVVVTLIGIIQNVTSTTIANLLASDANKTANKALEIAKLSIKGDVLPNLSIYYLPLSIDHQLFFLRNMNHGVASITLIEPVAGGFSITEISGEPIHYPIKLGYQSEHHFKFVPSEEINPSLRTLVFYKGMVMETRIVVLFDDELERKYILNLRYNYDTNSFVGSPSEVTNTVAL